MADLDLRQHLALERTLLAYLRTGLALVGVGFVLARFGLIVRELGLRSVDPHTHGLSMWLGSALVFVGGFIGPLAAQTYRRQLQRLNDAMHMREQPVPVAIALAYLLAVIGISMAVYLIWTG